MNFTRRDRIAKISEVSLIMILIADICFYTQTTYNIYSLLFAGGILLTFINCFGNFSLVIKTTNAIIWLTFIYALYFLYGFMFLQAGTFDWNGILARYFGNIAIYLSISNLVDVDKKCIIRPFVITGLFTVAYIILTEWNDIISGGLRIGDELSGNVNTVGFNLGFISIVVAWAYCLNRNKIKMIFLLIVMLFMLLTGSKKALIIVLLDFIMIFIYYHKRASTWLKLTLIVIAGFYLIFNVPYFYDILGSRIESMFLTMFIKNDISSMYSYSTDMREVMIKEGFHMFLRKPIFGGGWNYFAANTITRYDYSHCNYIELLCSFGIFGTLLYYSKQISNTYYIFSRRVFSYAELKDEAILSIILIIEMAFVDWATVTFSGQSAGYVPILLTCVLIDNMRKHLSSDRRCRIE